MHFDPPSETKNNGRLTQSENSSSAEPHTLHDFVRVGDLKEVRRLILEEGVDVGARDYCGLTTLHTAAKHGQKEILEFLLSVKSSDVNEIVGKIFNTITPLHRAISRGSDSLDLVKILVKAGADVNLPGTVYPPLHYAVMCNNLPVIKYLIQSCGVAVDIRDFMDLTPLHTACLYLSGRENTVKKSLEIVKFLLKNNASLSLFPRHLRGNYTPLRSLLDNLSQPQNYHSPELFKFYSFILEYSNLNGVRISFSSEEHKFHHIFFQHVAVLLAQGIEINFHQKITYELRSELDDFFNDCKSELSIAKNTKLGNSWVTFFKLLTDNLSKIKNYVANEDLMKDLQEKTDLSLKFPIYGAQMQERVRKGIKRRQLYDRSCNVLSYLMPIFDPFHLIVRDTLNCITSCKDLAKFCSQM